MVVHLNDLIAARCGEDPLSQKLNENLELVQKARLGPGYDSEATVLNRSVMYSDAGLTREADLRHAELAVARLRLQAARPQTSPGGVKPNAPLDHEELEPDGQTAYHSVSARLTYLASDRPDTAFVYKECKREVKGNTGRSHTLETKRTILAPHATSRVGVLTARRGECRDD